MKLQDKSVITGKTGNANPAIARAAEGLVFKSLLVSLIMLFSFQVYGQCLPEKMPFNDGEYVDYDIYFRWGVLMPRAGHGRTSFNTYSTIGQENYKYQLTFQTTKFFDAIFRMRDTLDCFYGYDYMLLHSSKRTNEGGRYSVDEMSFSYADGKSFIRSQRYTPEIVKIDTFITVNSGCVTDMLGATFWLRTLDWDNMRIGNSYTSTVAIGRDLVNITFRYQGQSIVERGDVKYRTHYFLIDIFDDAFEQNRSAAEIWVGDDENYIPIKIRTKLKIGYAEVYYRSSSNLKAPLTSRIEMKR